MLVSLSVNNYVLIKEMFLAPDAGLNVITGETGSGKSILLAALGLVLGNRAESGIAFDEQNKCVVEAVFGKFSKQATQFLQDNELDIEDELLLRREIATNGKSRAFINDTPVSLQQLRELASLLVEIHTQHTGLLIRDQAEQLKLVDDFAGNGELLSNYIVLWNSLKSEEKVLQSLVASKDKNLAEYEFSKFQFDEIDAFNPNPTEDDYLEDKANQINHAADIVSAVSAAWGLVTENDPSAYQLLALARTALKSVANVSQQVKSLFERLEIQMTELQELGADLARISDHSQPNPQELEHINQRLSHLQHLLKKHGVENASDLVSRKELLEAKLYETEHFEDSIQKQKQKVDLALTKCTQLADQLSQKRLAAGQQLSTQAQELMAQLGMPKAHLKVRVEHKTSQLGVTGADSVVIMFNANGNTLQELEKVASGGEVSRLNFVFKALLAGKKSMPTLIFDEADTGVSGEVAFKLGSMMQDLAKHHQVIAITHLPQVAAKGTVHFYVYKTEVEGKTVTQIQKLTSSQRVDVMAKLLSGESAGNAAVANAKELLGL